MRFANPDGTCPTCGNTHPLCSRCHQRRTVCPPDEVGEPFMLCDKCDLQDVAQEEAALNTEGSFGIGYHHTQLSISLYRCECGCDQTYLGGVLLDGRVFPGKLTVYDDEGVISPERMPDEDMWAGQWPTDVRLMD